MRGEIHHVDLTVHALDAALPFYAAVLEFMGYHHDRGEEWVLADGHRANAINLVAASGPHAGRANDRYAPGLHHLAIGATILDAPADYPQYNRGRGDYAVFFADPDGVKLEFVHTP